MEFLKENEVLDDLQLNNLMIIQNKMDYRFTSDSVLLANFAKAGRKDFVVEFCSGSGVISILLNEKCKPKKVIGFELQPQLCEMSNRSLKYNKIENINFVNKDLSLAYEDVGVGKVDVVICNPPYYVLPENQTNINKKFKLTKYETSTNLEDIFASA
ncbi:MAG: methyltransferase, partial [Clostridia bacterium]|nr:methyltransferase [Clostridia bacterium]